MNLFLDTSQSKCNIAIFEKEKIVDSISVPTKNNMTDIVVEKINALLIKNSVSKDKIKSIYITTGPGSFTGVRVSSLIAKSWNVIYKTKIFYLDSLSLQVPLGIAAVSVLDAKGKKYYASYHNEKGKITKKGKLIDHIEYLSIKKSGRKIYADYKKVNIFKNLILDIKSFNPCKDINKLKCYYIKKAL